MCSVQLDSCGHFSEHFCAREAQPPKYARVAETLRWATAMTSDLTEGERLAPIFIIADDDKEAIDRLVLKLNIDWYYIAVWQRHLVVRYARKLATTAVFLADSFGYPNGGAPRLMQDLIDKAEVPVVIMTETWTDEVAAQWRRMGAATCIPHPTRCEARIEGLRSTMEKFALDRAGHAAPGREENPARSGP